MTVNDPLLLFVPGLPLLLMLSSLRRFVPRAEYVAVLPAALLLLLPGEHFFDIPWLLFNAGFGYFAETRLLLLMAVLLWLPAAFYLTANKANGKPLADEQSSTFYFLTLGAYLGTILSTDVVSFFTFSTLMGYGFYGLLVDTDDQAVKRAGRVYLCFLVVADLLLFEAVLIVASVTEEQSFDAIRETMVDSPLSGLYLSMVVFGFALKAGVWPFHFWLPLAFRSARLPAVLLLSAVPVAIGLLGIMRWLPIGEIYLPVPGKIFQAIGGTAIAYAVVTWLMQRELKTLPAYITIFATGLFTVAIGTVLNNPDLWRQYADLAIYFIVFMAIVIALLTCVIEWREASQSPADKTLKASETTALWFEHWLKMIVNLGKYTGLERLPRLRALCLETAESCVQIHAWKKVLAASEFSLQRWPVGIILFLLVGIVTAILLIY